MTTVDGPIIDLMVVVVVAVMVAAAMVTFNVQVQVVSFCLPACVYVEAPCGYGYTGWTDRQADVSMVTPK